MTSSRPTTRPNRSRSPRARDGQRGRSASPVATALNRARRTRRETLRVAAQRSGLPVRYLAAFELDAAPRVFRSRSAAVVFLREYLRYLGLDDAHMARQFLSRHAAHPPSAAVPQKVLPPGRPVRAGRPTHRGRSLPPFHVPATLLVVALVGTLGVSSLVRLPGGRERRVQAPPAVRVSDPDIRVAAGVPVLPGGGRRLFPDHRVVAFYGSPVDHRLGRLGLGPPAFAAQALSVQASAYPDDRAVLPAFQVVATVTTRHPGRDGTYTSLLSMDTLRAYLEQARRIGGLLIIDIQPGRSSFPAEVRRYDALLKEPDVGLALDPEWRMGPNHVPGTRVGTVDAAELNEVVDHVAGIVDRYDLPQKLLVIHQFRPSMVTNRGQVRTPSQLAVTFDFDGVGGPRSKIAAYAGLARGVHDAYKGIKLYYDSDVGLLTPQQVVGLDPEPDLVIYQ